MNNEPYELTLVVYDKDSRSIETIPADKMCEWLKKFDLDLDRWSKICPDPGNYHVTYSGGECVVVASFDWEAVEIFLCKDRIGFLDLITMLIPIMRDLNIISVVEDIKDGAHETIRDPKTKKFINEYRDDWSVNNLLRNIHRIAEALDSR